MKLRMCTMQIQKEKVLFFCEKKFFFNILNFFPKGGPFCQKIFFQFYKEFQKQIPKMSFLGAFRHKKEQSQEFRWT